MPILRRFYRVVPAGLRAIFKTKIVALLPDSFFKFLFGRRLASLPTLGLQAYHPVRYDKNRLREAQRRASEKIAKPEDDLFVCGLRNVYLRLDRGLVELEDGRILIESSFLHSRMFRVVTMLGNPKPRTIPRLEGRTYATIVTMFDRNFYHWFIDTLPRLYLFDSLNLEEPVTLLMPADLKEYQVESLLCCLPPNMTVAYVDSEGVSVEKLLMPSNVGVRTNHYVPIELLDYVRNSVLRRYEPSDAESARYSRRIYISRALASRRRLLNEEAVVACLSKFGFSVVHAENLTLREQIAQFRDAEWIVGPHGAGFTNMLFARHVNVMEFLGDFGPSSWYFRRLASTLGRTHYFLTAEQKKKNADMMVDVTKLEEALKTLGLSSGNEEPSVSRPLASAPGSPTA